MQIGPYELLEEVARGGAGVVYRACTTAGLQVAVKVLALDDDPEEEARFATEARALARLSHPGIVSVHDAGTEGNRGYLAMEWVGGESLEGRLARKRALSQRQAAWIGHELALALEHAHQQGIVHRDLKPGNVMITLAGDPVLLDFGLARLRGRGGLTATGDVLGSPLYMAPEQAAGVPDQIGPATDVYGLGAVLYRMISGQPPFPLATLVECLAAIQDQEPTPLARLLPEVDPELSQIVARCLAKDPSERFESAAELAAALLPFAQGIAAVPPSGRAAAAVAVPPGSPSATPAWVLLSVGGMLLAAVVGVGVALARRRPSTPAPSPSAAVAASPEPGLPGVSPSLPAAVDDVEELLAQARARSDAGETGSALELAERAVTTSPDHPDALALRGDLRIQYHDLSGAASDAERALRADPNHAAALLLRARLRGGQGRIQEAQADLARLAELTPDDAEVWVEHARIAASIGDGEGARRAVERAVELAPGRVELWRTLATLCMELGDLRGALAAIEHAVEIAPDASESYFDRGTLLNMSGNPEAAMRDFNHAVELDPSRAENYVHRAIVHDDLNDLESALRDLERAIELDPKLALAFLNRGKMLLENGRPREGLRDLERALELTPPTAPGYRNLRDSIQQLRRELR